MKSERDYINGLITGSYKDFTSLYKQYAPLLYAFIFKLTKSTTRAKDILQETFINVWVHRKQTNPDLSFKSYLFTIARNLVLNEFRKNINSPILSDYLEYYNQEGLSENSTEQKIDLDEFNCRLQAAKKNLTPRQREIFEMNKEYGLSIQEIALKAAISEQSVRNQLSAAIQQLRKEMKEYLPLFILLFLA